MEIRPTSRIMTTVPLLKFTDAHGTCVGRCDFTDCMYVRKDPQISTNIFEICAHGTLHANVSHRFAGT